MIFEDLRVVELGDGMACSLAAMLFADNGAEVIKVEPRGGAASRENPAFPMWGRGKKSVVLDLADAAAREQVLRLIDGADVVITTFTAGEAGALGLDHASLAARNPAIVSANISGFGPIERLEPLGKTDAVVTARSGRVCNNHQLSGSHHGLRAIYLAAPLASCGAAFLAVQGITAALIKRLSTGKGQAVDTSLLDGLSAATMRLAFERQGNEIVPVEARGGGAELVLRCIRNCFITPECADGRYLQMCARQTQHFHNWIRSMELEHLFDDPRFADMPLGLKSFEDADELERIIRAEMKKRTMNEWIEVFSTRYDVGADPFLLPEEFLEHPQMVLNDRIVTLAHPEKGPVKQVGPLALFSRTPARIDRPAPRLGENQGELDALSRRPAPQPQQAVTMPASGSLEGEGPLAGLTILELAYFLAAPLAATTLAELGARVIKIEPKAGDPFRSSGLEFVHIAAGKESIAIDLKNPAGQEIFRRLVAGCDALLHNFRPGAPERLKVDYETAAAINPQLVYHYGASYGSKGPQSHRPAFHSTPNALCGGGILQAGKGNVPIDESYPDPIAGLGAGASLVMGLYARQKYGIGQYLETTMLTSSGFTHSEMLTRYAGAPPMPELDQGQHGIGALHRLYEGANGQYVFVSAREQDKWEALARALDQEALIADPRFADEAARETNADALAALLEPVFAAQLPQHWEDVLHEAGIDVAAAYPSFERFLADEGFLDQGEHPAFGSYWKLKPRIRLSDEKTFVREPSAVSEHARALLGEAGYDAPQIEQLIASGVVQAPAPQLEEA